MRRIIFLTLFLTAFVTQAWAQAALDSTLTVSLLTCSPGQAVYELYGHTALRVRSQQTGRDVVYNYGLFSFEQPHFVWRFVLGECDYMVGPAPTHLFVESYVERGSSVVEQVLNLKPHEANHLADTLRWNSEPGNCVYRYDIFRSNCTTRARDIIEACIEGVVIYPAAPRRDTYRTILHEYTKGHAWAQTGNDLLLGADIDTLITQRDEMFAPLRLMQYADGAMILTAYDAYRPLVAHRDTLLQADAGRQLLAAKAEPSFPIPPGVLAWGLLAAVIVLGVYEWRRRSVVWGVDAVLLTLQGVAGLLLTFMALCSQHPGVAHNWHILALNPLPLLCLYWVIRDERAGHCNIYHTVATLLLALFVVIYFVIPQDFPVITLPLALSLLARSVTNLVVNKQ